MSDFDINVTGDRRIDARFAALPDTVRARLREAMGSIIGELDARVTGSEPVRTGKLRGETRSFVDETKDLIRGRVRIVTKGAGAAEGGKAAALEYGAHGLSPVKAHGRTVSNIFGRMVAPTLIMVDAYSRQLNLPAHNFLRGPLAEMKGDIMERLRAAVEGAATA